MFTIYLYSSSLEGTLLEICEYQEARENLETNLKKYPSTRSPPPGDPHIFLNFYILHFPSRLILDLVLGDLAPTLKLDLTLFRMGELALPTETSPICFDLDLANGCEDEAEDGGERMPSDCLSLAGSEARLFLKRS